MLRTHLGEDVETPAADGERVLASDPPFDPGAFDHFVFLGRGWTIGLANEAALKFREAAGAWSESYPAMEYRHGPISVARPGSAIWPIGDVEADLLDDVAATGATVVASGVDAIDPMAELIAIQRAAVALADASGTRPGSPAASHPFGRVVETPIKRRCVVKRVVSILAMVFVLVGVACTGGSSDNGGSSGGGGRARSSSRCGWATRLPRRRIRRSRTCRSRRSWTRSTRSTTARST